MVRGQKPNGHKKHKNTKRVNDEPFAKGSYFVTFVLFVVNTRGKTFYETGSSLDLEVIF